MPTDQLHIDAHKHSSRHRQEILDSASCGCFYCQSIFPPSEIVTWVDDEDGVGQTALCPHCGIDSVIGSVSTYPITRDFLTRMRRHWFGSRRWALWIPIVIGACFGVVYVICRLMKYLMG